MNEIESGACSPPAASVRAKSFFADRSSSRRVAIVCSALAAAVVAAAAVTLHPVALAAAAALAGCAGALFIFRHPAILLWSLILTAPLTDYLGLYIGKTIVRPYEPLALLGVFWIVWQFLSRSQSVLRGTVVYYRGTLLILALYFMSKLLTVYALTVLPPNMTKYFVLRFIVLAALQMAAAFVCAGFISSLEQLKKILRVWVHVANAICLLALVQVVVSNVTPYNFVWDKDLSPLGRPYSVFREPDVLGCFYVSFLMLIFPLLVSKATFINRTYLWLSFAFNTLFFLLVVVRAAWIAGVICLMLYAILTAMTGRLKALMPYVNGAFALLMFAVLGLAMAAPKAIEKLSERLSTVAHPDSDSATAYRLMELKAQSEMAFHPQPANGGQMAVALGYGDFSWTHWRRVTCDPDNFRNVPKDLATDGFCMGLSVQFNNGLAGLALCGAFYLALTLNFLRVLKRAKDAQQQALLSGSYLSVLAMLICFQFSNDPLFLCLWIVLGFHLAAVYHIDKIESA